MCHLVVQGYFRLQGELKQEAAEVHGVRKHFGIPRPDWAAGKGKVVGKTSL